MIPRLLKSAFVFLGSDREKRYDISHNGFGFLTDLLSCEVSETLNGEYKLTATYPVGGKLWDKITRGMVIVAMPNEYTREQAFVIKTVKKRANDILSIDAEHISYNANGIMVTGFNADSTYRFKNNMLNNAIDNYFVFSTDIDKRGWIGNRHKGPRSLRSFLLDDSQPSFLSLYGGEFEFKGINIYAHESRGEDRGVTYTYGSNIIGMTLTETMRDYPDGVYPFWVSPEAKPVDTPVYLPEKIVWFGDSEFLGNEKTIPLDLSDRFESQPTEEQLREAVEDWKSVNIKDSPPFSLSISVLDLSKTLEYNYLATQKVVVGDIVTVNAPEYFGDQVKVKVVKTVYDVLTEQYKKIEVGDVLPDFSDSIRKLVGVI